MKKIFILLALILALLTNIYSQTKTRGIISLTQNEEQTRQYINWILITIFTNYFFSLFVKKNRRGGKLLATVLIPVWLIMSFIVGVEDFYVLGENAFLSLSRFTNHLAFNLVAVLFIGGITFHIKYRKIKKTLERQSNSEEVVTEEKTENENKNFTPEYGSAKWPKMFKRNKNN